MAFNPIPGVDLNDQTNLDLCFNIRMFKDDGTRNELQLGGFARSKQVAIHLISESMNLEYEYSAGTGVAKISRPQSTESRTVHTEGAIDSVQAPFPEADALDVNFPQRDNELFDFEQGEPFRVLFERDAIVDNRPVGADDPFLSYDSLDQGSNIQALWTSSVNGGYHQAKETASSYITKRGDQWVKLACTYCHRDNFSSYRGFINHSRTIHRREFKSHEEAVHTSGQPIEPNETGLSTSSNMAPHLGVSSTEQNMTQQDRHSPFQQPSTSISSFLSKRKRSQGSSEIEGPETSYRPLNSPQELPQTPRFGRSDSVQSEASGTSGASGASGRRGPLSEVARAGMKAVRKIGACWRCFFLRKKCGPDNPCLLCPKGDKSNWEALGCHRGDFKTRMPSVYLCPPIHRRALFA